jgi:hypothetical protein
VDDTEFAKIKKRMTAMGYNRAGEARKQRLKRQKREIARIVAKLEAAGAAETKSAPAKPAAAKK